MTPFNLRRLGNFRQMFGPMSAEAALNLAIEAEAISRACWADQAGPHFAQQKIHLEQYAYLLAEEEKEKT